jgi:uncharacterized protein YndB with AHSA1/START domain
VATTNPPSPDSLHAAPEAERSIVLSRRFDAPRELVFAAWTRPEHVAAWFGPDGFTLTTYEMDVRPGGRWHFTMHGPDGTDYPNLIRYREVVAPSHLVYDQNGGDDDPTPPFHVTVTFEAVGSQTELTLRMVFATREHYEHVVVEYGAIEGGEQTLGRLAAFLEAPR